MNMQLDQKERVARQRANHHLALEALALRVGCQIPGKLLWRKLRRIENWFSKAVENYSNDSAYGLERWEKDKERARQELAAIFGGTIPPGVYLNSDPRGHALKLDCDEAEIPQGMEKDWGGNGILAAEIN